MKYELMFVLGDEICFGRILSAGNRFSEHQNGRQSESGDIRTAMKTKLVTILYNHHLTLLPSSIRLDLSASEKWVCFGEIFPLFVPIFLSG